MRYVLLAEEMKYCDNYTIEKIGIPSLLLMERAAMEMAAEITLRKGQKSRVLIVAGVGNNGGDAFAVGRLLAQKEYSVTFYLVGDRNKASKETNLQITILENLGFSIHDNFPKGEYDIIIDGLFGIGLSREICGIYREAILKVNELHQNGVYVASADIPSGICADTGKVLGCAVQADLTVTFAYAKAGHYFYPGREYTGELVIRSIGICGKAFDDKEVFYHTADKEMLQDMLPERKSDGNKGSFGKVLVFAGNEEMCGAAILCARAVFASGGGMVKIMTPKQNRVVLQKVLPEAMIYTYEDVPDEMTVQEAYAWADVIVAGPGIGQSMQAKRSLMLLLSLGRKPVVIDADGLNLIATEEELQKMVCAYEKGQIIMTPHPGELARLAGKTISECKENKREAVKEISKHFGCVVAGKDAVTLVANPACETVFLNYAGNDGMAVAGSGDVLAGIIGGFLAQGTTGFEAACLGVFVHALAGDEAAERKSRYGMMPTDILECLDDVLKEAEGKRSL